MNKKFYWLIPALFLALGGLSWLAAGPLGGRQLRTATPPMGMQMGKQPPSARPWQGTEMASTTDRQSTETEERLANLAVEHPLGEISVAPGYIVSGSLELVSISIRINDTSLLTNSVTLLEQLVDGRLTTLGLLYDDGQNGDIAAADGVFTVRRQLSTLGSGEHTFRISAAFRGTLLRSLSQPFTFSVLPAINTVGWRLVDDPSGAFSLNVPPEWPLSVVNTPGEGGDDLTYRTVSFSFPGDQYLFSIFVFAAPAWVQEQSLSSPIPVYLGERNGYVFAYGISESAIIQPGFDDDLIRSQLNQVLASFRLK